MNKKHISVFMYLNHEFKLIRKINGFKFPKDVKRKRILFIQQSFMQEGGGARFRLFL